MRVDLGRSRCEEAAAREDAPFDVREEAFAERLERAPGGRLSLGGADDLLVEDLAGGLDRRELQFLLRAEVGVETALRDAYVAGEPGDREAVQPIGRGELRRGAHDRLVGPLAVRAPLPKFGRHMPKLALSVANHPRE